MTENKNKKVYIINGSPRQSWNTLKMCEKFEEGLQSKDIDVEIINLYSYNFKGCYNCFACKSKDGKSYGKCAYPDGITDLLNKISQADGIVFASPIYFGDVTGVMRCFYERLFFPFFVDDKEYTKIQHKKPETAIIYTMAINVTKEIYEKMYIGNTAIGNFTNIVGALYNEPEVLCAFDTYQFEDSDKDESDKGHKELKAQQREEVLKENLENVYNAGVRMAEKILA